MKVLWGGILADARGKIGGWVASRNRAGAYLRSGPSPVNPNTELQQTVRSAMTQAAQRWRDTLTPAQRDAWLEYAQGTPLVDGFGLSQTHTGNVMYTRVNAMLIRYGETPIDDAPVVPGEAGQLLATLGSTTILGNQLTAFTPALVTADFIQIQEARAASSQAKIFYNGPFTDGQIIPGDEALPFLLRDPLLVAVGQRWFYRFRVIQEDGKTGPASIFRVDTLA